MARKMDPSTDPSRSTRPATTAINDPTYPTPIPTPDTTPTFSGVDTSGRSASYTTDPRLKPMRATTNSSSDSATPTEAMKKVGTTASSVIGHRYGSRLPR